MSEEPYDNMENLSRNPGPTVSNSRNLLDDDMQFFAMLDEDSLTRQLLDLDNVCRVPVLHEPPESVVAQQRADIVSDGLLTACLPLEEIDMRYDPWGPLQPIVEFGEDENDPRQLSTVVSCEAAEVAAAVAGPQVRSRAPTLPSSQNADDRPAAYENVRRQLLEMFPNTNSGLLHMFALMAAANGGHLTDEHLSKLAASSPTVPNQESKDVSRAGCSGLRRRSSNPPAALETTDQVPVRPIKSTKYEDDTPPDSPAPQKFVNETEEDGRNINPEDFLHWFEDNPFLYFARTDRRSTGTYMAHAYAALCNTLLLTEEQIVKEFQRNGYLYAPTLRSLERKYCFKAESLKKKPDRPRLEYPAKRNELFEIEYAFCKREDDVTAHVNELYKKRNERYDNAERNGELVKCENCGVRVLADECVRCHGARYHQFCKECVRSDATQAIANNVGVLRCLAERCTSWFRLETLRSVLRPMIFSNLLLIKFANGEKLTDLVQCPHCAFAAIVPDDIDVFQCLNIQCFKESCRCGKKTGRLHCLLAVHFPFPCEGRVPSSDGSYETREEEEYNVADKENYFNYGTAEVYEESFAENLELSEPIEPKRAREEINEASAKGYAYVNKVNPSEVLEMNCNRCFRKMTCKIENKFLRCVCGEEQCFACGEGVAGSWNQIKHSLICSGNDGKECELI